MRNQAFQIHWWYTNKYNQINPHINSWPSPKPSLLGKTVCLGPTGLQVRVLALEKRSTELHTLPARCSTSVHLSVHIIFVCAWCAQIVPCRQDHTVILSNLLVSRQLHCVGGFLSQLLAGQRIPRCLRPIQNRRFHELKLAVGKVEVLIGTSCSRKSLLLAEIHW